MARENCLLLFGDGRIHYPFSRFLTDHFDNPHTRGLVGQSLRIFGRFLEAHRIELATRAIDGHCLSLRECKQIAGLCYRPLPEIENLTDKQIVLITSAVATRPPDARPNAVRQNTVKRHLIHIAAFLKHYSEQILSSHVRSNSIRVELISSYQQTCDSLRSRIGGEKENHHHNIKSMPGFHFLKVIREVYLYPEKLFLTDLGKATSTLYRDRAMTLLACENMRPGSIGNIFRKDFNASDGYLEVKDHRRARAKRPTTGTPVLKLGDSKAVNSASETMLKLYPFTIDAVNDYINLERGAILAERLTNNSNGFLFLNNKGEPIGHRSTITRLFNRLGKQLDKLGLLDVARDPYVRNKKKYEFNAYVLRHSAASLYLAEKGTAETIKDSMKIRFGWTANSKMPETYAARAMSDAANVDLMDFYTSIVTEARQLKS